MAHALASHLGTRHFDAATLTDDPPEPDALVLAAVTLPIACRTKDSLVEEAILLGLQRPVIDRLRLPNLAVGPRPDLVTCRQVDLELVKVLWHPCSLSRII